MAPRRKKAGGTTQGATARRRSSRRAIADDAQLFGGTAAQRKAAQQQKERLLRRLREEKGNPSTFASLPFIADGRQRKAFIRRLAERRDAKFGEQLWSQSPRPVAVFLKDVIGGRMRQLAVSIADGAEDREACDELMFLVMMIGMLPPGFGAVLEDVARRHPRGASRVFSVLARAFGLTEAAGRPRVHRPPNEAKDSRARDKVVVRLTDCFLSLRSSRDRLRKPWLAGITDVQLVDLAIDQVWKRRRSLSESIFNAAVKAFRAERSLSS